MAVDMHMLEMEVNHNGGDGNRAEPDQPENADGNAAETAAVYKKGAWSKEEDEKLRQAVEKYGLRNWVAVEKYSGRGEIFGPMTTTIPITMPIMLKTNISRKTTSRLITLTTHSLQPQLTPTWRKWLCPHGQTVNLDKE
ncbi:hypothetical protein CASFOL_042201 [Castilleja foliolosa]|uniref:Uncharacterized protein n=1 Tax=Castilleja foliolosa TaxID=1961234 RepID=A0ABD3B9W3_9LAMI